MKKLLLIFILCIAVAISMYANGEKESSDKDVYVFKYSNAQTEEHPRTQSMMYFKKKLEKKSNGRIKVEIYHSGVLGNEKEQFDQLSTGIIHGYRGAYYALLNPQYFLYNLPFLFADAQEVIKLNNSDFMKKVNRKASENGSVYIPAVGSSGFRNIVNTKRALEKPSDFKGISFRSPSQFPIIEFYKVLGANPQEMSSSEVYLALSSGVIDGACSSNGDLDTWKVAEVTDYLTVINYVNGADPFMVNKAWYNTLSQDLKDIFDEVSRDTMIKSDTLRIIGEEIALKKLKQSITNVNIVEGTIREEYKKLLQPVWDKLVAKGYFSQEDIKQAQEAIQN